MHQPSNQAAMPEPIFDVAELSAVELFSPDVDRTIWFFRDLLGMIETGRDIRVPARVARPLSALAQDHAS